MCHSAGDMAVPAHGPVGTLRTDERLRIPDRKGYGYRRCTRPARQLPPGETNKESAVDMRDLDPINLLLLIILGKRW